MKIWVIKLFKHFFFTLDSVLFNFIPTIYNLLISISRTTILSQATIHAFADRIQMLLGIFMLFKVSFSLIMYVVNPDDFSDKSKGIGKLAQNTVISLVMLAVVPYIFNMAYKLQAMVLEDNTLARLILGNVEEENDVSYINTAGDTMAFYLLVPFFSPNTAIELDETSADMSNCVNLVDQKEEINNDCLVALNIAFGENEGHAEITAKDKLEDNLEKIGTITANYVQGIRHKNIGLFFRVEALSTTYEPDDGDEEFVIDYNWPITTVVAVVVLLVLLSYCLDVALRSVKLAFLQLISPIPIISYMDPKSGKDGMFSKWTKMCVSTYISLFVRLLALYFGVYIITQVGKLYDVVDGSVVDNFIVKIFIIIGVLMFIKQLPKILENIGIKLDGDGKFTLNPFKKIGDGAIGVKTVGKGIGAAGIAGAGAMAANAWATKGNWKGSSFKDKLKNVGSIVGGGFSGAARGGFSKEKNLFKAGRAGVKGAVDKRNLRDQRNATGYHIGRRTMDNINKFSGVDPLEKYEKQMKEYGEISQKANQIFDRAGSEMIKHDGIKFKDDAGNDVTMADFKNAKEYLESLRSLDTSTMSDAERIKHVKKINQLQASVGKTEKFAKQAYVDEVLNGSITDEETRLKVMGLKNDVTRSTDNKVNSHKVVDGDSIKTLSEDMDIAKAEVENDENYKRLIINKKVSDSAK